MANRLIIEEIQPGQLRVGFRRAGHDFDEAPAEPIAFASPFTPEEREDLRWYLEDYLKSPYAVYEQRGQGIEAKLAGWGHALFDSVFGPSKPGRDAYQKSREGVCDLVLRSASPGFLGLPWELMQDPERATPLALELRAVDRTLGAAGAAAPEPPGPELRVLMVIARPAGPKDIGYQMIARPLLERLQAVRGDIVLEVLRPPTLEALTAKLQAAAESGRPYHILHFDGHGMFGSGPAQFNAQHYDAGGARGYLLFEKESGGNHLVPADDFALIVNRARVPLIVLNACRSGMLGAGEAAIEAAVATRLLEGGAASVVAMGYSVYAVAAAEFMTAFYEALFARKPVSEAVAEGRRRLHRRRDRPSPKGLLPLEDWIVPVHYLRSTISFAGLKQSAAPKALSLDTLLDQLRPNGAQATPAASNDLAPDRRFIGRDAEFYTLERALRLQRVVIVQGPAGTGKTELAKGFGRWWQDTGGVEKPEWVFFHAFEPGVASFGLDGVITEIGLKLFGPDFIGRTQDAAQRETAILKLLCERRMLLIWDNVETLHDLPDPSGATPPLDEAERQKMRRFLEAVARDGESGILLTSRTAETWLGDRRRVALGGLSPSEAIQLADDLLAPFTIGWTRRQGPDFADLLEWLDGHPLSLRLLLPQLEQVSAANLLVALKGNAASLPPGFVGEGRLASLGASLKYSFDHLAPALRERAAALSLFEGVADVRLLGVLSTMDGVPARFAGVTTEDWVSLLQRLAGLGVLTSLGTGMVALHPALPSYLAAEWRRSAGTGFAAERAAAEQALLEAYARFGVWLTQQISGGAADRAMTLVKRQRRTMGRLLGFALTQQRYDLAQALMQPLNEYWDYRGFGQEAEGWVDRCREKLEDRSGTPPDLDSPAGSLWLFAVGSEAKRAIAAGALGKAQATYDLIRRLLEASPGPSQQFRLSVVYHQLGAVAQDRGDLAAAEDWYRQSLAINESLGDRPGLATSYHQLGNVAQERGDLAAAEDWSRQSLAIKEALGDRPGLGSSYGQLGNLARKRRDLVAAEDWYRRSLAIHQELVNQPRLAADYHNLGIVAQHRGDLAAAEDWYRQSLTIEEALGNRPGLAVTYAQLGLLSEARDATLAALDWNTRCVALFPEFSNSLTRTGPDRLVDLTRSLGLPALEASWQRCTGASLPDAIRATVTRMMAEPQAPPDGSDGT